MERIFRSRAAFFQTSSYRLKRPRKLSFLKTVFVWIYFSSVLGASTFLVFGRLLYKSFYSSWDWPVLLKATWGSLFTSGLAATFSVIVGFVLVYLAYRGNKKWNHWFLKFSYAGYVLPGPMVGVALIIFFYDYSFLSFLYGSVAVIIFAYLIRFIPFSLLAHETAINQITPDLEEVARLSGIKGWKFFSQVLFPLMKSGFWVGWIFVFLQSFRELPATLLLRPVGFDTLAIRVWMETNNEFFTLASPAALILVLFSLPFVVLMLNYQFQYAKIKQK